MKFLLTAIGFLSLNGPVCAQQITWATDVINPEKDRSGLDFIGCDSKNYYMAEHHFQTKFFKSKWSTVIKGMDLQTLKEVYSAEYLQSVDEGDKTDYNLVDQFIMGNHLYRVVIDEGDKTIFNVYGSVQSPDRRESNKLIPLGKVDVKKIVATSKSSYTTKRELSLHRSYYASRYAVVAPAYDSGSVLSALVYEHPDDATSMINISEWNRDLKNIVSVNYQIPFACYIKKIKQGIMPYDINISAEVKDVKKDNNGFIYVLMLAMDKKGQAEDSYYAICRFKPSDPADVVITRAEFKSNIAPTDAQLYQDMSGKVFFAMVGLEVEKEKDRYYPSAVNSAVIGGFNKQGKAEIFFSGKLSNEFMYQFESESSVNKKGSVSGLLVREIFPLADGGIYVVWEQFSSEIKEGVYYLHDYQNFDNVVIQRYNKDGRLAWQKPIYKKQVGKDGAGVFCGIKTFCQNDKLLIFYADDKKNAQRSVEDSKVAEYTVVKFANKDLTGMFMVTFDPSGKMEKKYISWPDNRVGFALATNSLVSIGNNEFVGTVRKIKQGALNDYKNAEYSIFRIRL